MKTCAACGTTYTLAAWRALPRLGSMHPPDDGGPPAHLELRNCPCHGTMAVDLHHLHATFTEVPAP